MTMRFLILIAVFSLLSTTPEVKAQQENDKYLTHTVKPTKDKIHFYWQNENGKNLGNFKKLKAYLLNYGDTLVFATNGGMFKKDLSPVGLYIENGVVRTKIDTKHEKKGNFYMQPNGVFYIKSDSTAYICETKKFKLDPDIIYATQSGPLLLIDGDIHPEFNKNSFNVHIRNGVGVLPNGELLFAMSKVKVTFYEFANFFLKHGCKYALYLDGFVSKTYLPSAGWEDTNGMFGVMIGVVK